MMFVPKPDRRKSDRLNVSGCLACRATNARVIAALRTDHVVYFRCVDCGNLWSMSKPASSAQNRELGSAERGSGIVVATQNVETGMNGWFETQT